ncbi:MAG: prephenate dehydratase [Pseudohongiellaceae bacterium]|nr:prephenate dehydratase [Pseudohongiellaceae bacterium]
MSESDKNPVTVAYLGPSGTFTHAAALKYFAAEAVMDSVASIDDVFAAVESDRASYGVVPVENSTEGAVNFTQDCLVDTSLQIIAEVIIPISHNFLVAPGIDPSTIKLIVSHRQSLAQCRTWLANHWPNVEKREVSSNAEAARQAAADTSIAAIAGEQAAAEYGLDVLEAGIQDQRNNCTRFLVLAKHSVPATGSDKTSILVYTENTPGALFRVLEPFNTHQVSLTKIETRPARDANWAYVFFIDFEGHIDDEAVKRVLDELQHRTVKIKQLGSYPKAAE